VEENFARDAPHRANREVIRGELVNRYLPNDLTAVPCQRTRECRVALELTFNLKIALSAILPAAEVVCR